MAVVQEYIQNLKTNPVALVRLVLRSVLGLYLFVFFIVRGVYSTYLNSQYLFSLAGGLAIETMPLFVPSTIACPAYDPNTNTMGTINSLTCRRIESFTNNPQAPFTGPILASSALSVEMHWIDGYSGPRSCIMAQSDEADVDFGDSQVFCTVDSTSDITTFYPYSGTEDIFINSFGLLSKLGGYVPKSQGKVFTLENKEILSDLQLPLPQFVHLIDENPAIGYPAAPNTTFYAYHYIVPMPIVYSQVYIYSGWQFLATFGGMAAGVYVGYRLLFWIICRIFKLDPEAQ